MQRQVGPDQRMFGRAVEQVVLVAGIERIAQVGAGRADAQLVEIALIDARGQRADQQIVERGLAALLVPWPGGVLVLDGQAVALGHVPAKAVVEEFVGRLERGNGQTVPDAEAGEEQQPERHAPGFEAAEARSAVVCCSIDLVG